MISVNGTSQHRNNWASQVIENCCLMEEMRYASEQLRKAMSHLPANISLDGVAASILSAEHCSSEFVSGVDA